MDGSQIVTEIIVDARAAQDGVATYGQTLDQVGASTETLINKTDGLAQGFNLAGQDITKAASLSVASLDRMVRGMDAAYATSRQLEDGQRKLSAALAQVDTLYTKGQITETAAAARSTLLRDAQMQLAVVQGELASGTITVADAQGRISGVFNAGAAAVAEQRAEYQALTRAATEAAAAQTRLQAEIAAERSRFQEAGDSGLMGAVDQQKAANGAFRADQYQKMINSRLGVREPSSGAAQQSASAFTGADDAADRYLRAIDPQYAAIQRLKTAQTDLRQAVLAVGLAERDEGETEDTILQRKAALTQKLKEVEAAYTGVVSGTKTTGDAMKVLQGLEGAAEGGAGSLRNQQMELMHVGRSLFDSWAAGIPITQSLSMETGRLVQVGASLPLGFLAGAAAVAAVVGPVVALGLAGAEAGERLKETQRILALTGDSAGLTTGQFTAMSAGAAAAAGISRSAALSIQQGYATTGVIGGTMLGRLTAATQDWARATGQSADDAGKQLAAMFSDPAKGAEDLNKITHSIGLDEMDRIRSLERSGDLYGAQDRLLQSMLSRLQEMAKLKPEKGTVIGAWISNQWTSFGEWADPSSVPQTEESLQKRKAALQEQLKNVQAHGGVINPGFLNLQTTEGVQSDIDKVQRQIDALHAGAAAAAKGAQTAAAVQAGQTVSPIIDSLDASRAQAINDQLAALKKAFETVNPETGKTVISTEQYTAAVQKLRAELAGIQSPYQKFIDLQKIEKQVAAAPVGERQALRARLMAENEAATINGSGAEKAAMISGAQAAVNLQHETAYEDHVDAMKRDEEARRRIADAYSRSPAAGARQEVVEAVQRDADANPYGYAGKQDDEVQKRLNLTATSSFADLEKQASQIGDRNRQRQDLTDDGSIGMKDQSALQARTIAEKALNDAIAAGDTALQARIAVLQDKIAVDLHDTAVAEQKVRIRQEMAQGDQQIQTLQAEIGAVGMDADARAVLIARLTEEQKLRQQLGALYTAPEMQGDIQSKIDQAGKIAELNSQLQHTQAVYKEIPDAISSGVDRIGSAFTQMVVQGGSAAAGLKNIWSAVISEIAQEAIKLSIVNPLKNMLPGAAQSPSLYGGGGGAFGGGGGFLNGGLMQAAAKGITGWLFGPEQAFTGADTSQFVAPSFSADEFSLASNVPMFAGGGQVHGPGTSTSDSIHAKLSDGEFVVKADAASRHLDLLHAINDNNVPAFADGGPVGRPVSRNQTAPAAASAAPPPGGGMQVNIHNYASGDTDVQARPSANGGGLDLVLTKKAQGDIATGRMDRTMRANYGIGRTPTSRI